MVFVLGSLFLGLYSWVFILGSLFLGLGSSVLGLWSGGLVFALCSEISDLRSQISDRVTARRNDLPLPTISKTKDQKPKAYVRPQFPAFQKTASTPDTHPPCRRCAPLQSDPCSATDR